MAEPGAGLLPDLPDLNKIKVSEPEITEEVEHLFVREKQEYYHAHIKGMHQDRIERKIYAKKIYNLMCAWMIGLAFIIFLNGWSYDNRFRLSEKVLLALIGSVTIEVIGLFVIVAKYLFPSKNNSK